MSLKKKATEALKDLTLLVESLAHESKQKALAQINVVTRFVGELRQEKSALKQRAEKAEAESEPLREQLHELKSQLSDVRRELDTTQQQLSSTTQHLDHAENHLIAATLVEDCDTPQGRLAHLIPGPEQPSASTPAGRKAARQKRRKQLHNILPEALPPFNLQVLEAKGDMILVHQDAFACDYHADEYTMLGMAIKFAGDHGKSVSIHGWSGETCGEEWAEEVEQLREQGDLD